MALLKNSFIFFALCYISGVATQSNKQLGLFNVIKFKNDVCTGNDNRNGTCYTEAECDERNGVGSGSCAEGYGVCCVIKLTECDTSSSDNCTYLYQPTVSKITTPSCTYKLCPSSSAICRIRLDFIKFDIGLPYDSNLVAANNAEVGDCVSDTFSLLSGTGFGSPVICGTNTGQHMYVDVTDNLCARAVFGFETSATTSRSYDIKVTQWECNDEYAGPPGCLQYHTAVSGTVSSFNYDIGQTSVTQTGDGQTTHLSAQNYRICIRRASGYCSICYVPAIRSATAASSFGLSLSAIATQATHDSSCNTDYLVIPEAEDTTAKAVTAQSTFGKERICGRFFTAITNGQVAAVYASTAASVCSGVVPFTIGVVTDQDEVGTAATATDAITEHREDDADLPNGTIGFSLNYVQQKCT